MIGIIVFNKSFGRYRQTDKLLYKFFPNNSKEIYLVPYVLNKSFIKSAENKYATVTMSLYSSGVYKIVILDSIIGSVSDYPSYCDYEMYCKNLISPKANQVEIKQAKEKLSLELDAICQHYQIENRDGFIFTIDSNTTTDFDDALSVTKTDNGWDVSIYISNVPILLDYLNLWDIINKVATVYLPLKKRGLFPSSLESLFSLKEEEERIVYVMDIHIEKTISCDFSRKKIKISKNFVYEEYDLLNNVHYQNLTILVDRLTKEYSIPDLIPKNSYDYVAFLMILMNIHCADELDEHGIMRRVIGSSSSSIPSDLPEEVKSYLKRKQETLYGEYVAFNNSDDLYHSLLKVEAYAHVTSPIRRVVDIVNLTNLHLDILSPSAKDFCKKWTLQTDFINQTCRNIKLVESNCQLLYECTKNKTYVGYIIKKEQHESGKELKNDLKTDAKELKNDLKDWVYIPALKLTTKLYQNVKRDYEEYAKIKVKPIIIVKEFTAYKKVRLIPV